MSGIFNTSLDGSNSNFPDTTGRLFATSFSAQSATAPSFHHSGGLQGLHNIHGSFNAPNMPGSLASRNPAINGVQSSGVQQPGGSISTGRFATNNFPMALSQISHSGSHGHSGLANRGSVSVVGNPAYNSSMNGVGNSIPGVSSSSTGGNRSSIPSLGVSPILQNIGTRIGGSMGNIGSMGRGVTSGGLSVPGLASRVNLTSNSGSGGHNVEGVNRFMSGILQQAPQMIGMLGNSYSPSGGPLSQNQLQAANSQFSSMAMLNDVNSNETAPFDINDFPQLTGRPNSSGGAQAQLNSLRKQTVGVNSIRQQNQEFSIQNEDFPALPGFKGGSSDFSMDLHQKEQLHENLSMMQSPHFPRSGGFSLGGAYSSSRQQQQQHATSIGSAGVSFIPGNNQDLLHLNGSDLFPSSHAGYQSQIQTSGAPSIGMRPLNSPSLASGVGTYEQLMQQYQHPRLQQISATAQYKEQNVKSMQGSPQPLADRFGLLGLLSVIRMNDADLTSLALGIDLTTLGLNLNSPDNLYKTFASPWSNQPAEGEPQYKLSTCYYAKPSPTLNQNYFSKFNVHILMYIFYSMPKDEAQLYAAHELHARGWFYHKQLQAWFTRAANTEPLVKTNTHERGTYIFFDKDNWEAVRKENFVLHYDLVEKKPLLPPQRPQH